MEGDEYQPDREPLLLLIIDDRLINVVGSRFTETRIVSHYPILTSRHPSPLYSRATIDFA